MQNGKENGAGTYVYPANKITLHVPLLLFCDAAFKTFPLLLVSNSNINSLHFLFTFTQHSSTFPNTLPLSFPPLGNIPASTVI
jgi:hypothetical protein